MMPTMHVKCKTNTASRCCHQTFATEGLRAVALHLCDDLSFELADLPGRVVGLRGVLPEDIEVAIFGHHG